MLTAQLQHKIRSGVLASKTSSGPTPKRGDAIIAGADVPGGWDGFVGQTQAISRLRLAVASAKARGARLEHTLLASGLHGVGKTTLAKLIAHDMGVGFTEMSGVITVDEARAALVNMRDNDVLFLDEVHLLVAGGKSKAEWLLHLLQGGVLMTARGAEPMPNITVMAATTDAQKLPETLLSRFMLKPVLVGYDDAQGNQVAASLADRMGIAGLDADVVAAVARASNNSPRDMKALLVTVRDQVAVGQGIDFDQVLDFAGVTADGLDALAQDYLMVLLAQGGTAGSTTMGAALGEPGPLLHTEKLLIQRGYVEVAANGRSMTATGSKRTVELCVAKGILPADALELAA